MRAVDVSIRYGAKEAVTHVSIDVQEHEVLALIGPSGCGKSTFLRALNRMNDTIDGVTTTGVIELDGEPIYAPDVDPVLVRRRVGMVFQRSNPFPKSMFDNVAYGLRIGGERNKRTLEEKVELALRQAALWDEVKDRLDDSALSLSGGQQQRLCIARALAVEPEVLLMDEPASALDPIATAKVEQLITSLAAEVTIVLVTHNMFQAARVSDYVAVVLMGEDRVGELVEVGPAERVLHSPSDPRTLDYVSGRVG